MKTRTAAVLLSAALLIGAAPKPAKGVAAGLVVAYGRALAQPYVFESRDGVLLVNGVQVEPPPAGSGELDEYQQRRRLAEKVRAYYLQNKAKAAPEELRTSIIAMVMATPSIATASWRSGETVIYTRKNDPYAIQNAIDFAPRRDELLGQAADYESYLAKGGCLFFFSDGGVWRGEDPKDAVKAIKGQTGLTSAQKARRLKEVPEPWR